MSTICAEVHSLVRSGTRHSCPFDGARLPSDGIYVLFETGEESHNGARIVRVGTHRVDGRLLERLDLHFSKDNKDTSIFRKNVGRALLNRRSDPFLGEWEMRVSAGANVRKRRAIEREVTRYLQSAFSFVVFRVDDQIDRKRLESKIISTVSLCDECKPSSGWLGLSSPKERIRRSGLWLRQRTPKAPLTPLDLRRLRTALT